MFFTPGLFLSLTRQRLLRPFSRQPFFKHITVHSFWIEASHLLNFAYFTVRRINHFRNVASQRSWKGFWVSQLHLHVCCCRVVTNRSSPCEWHTLPLFITCQSDVRFVNVGNYLTLSGASHAEGSDKKRRNLCSTPDQIISLHSRLSALCGGELIQPAWGYKTSWLTYLSKLQVLHWGLVF